VSPMHRSGTPTPTPTPTPVPIFPELLMLAAARTTVGRAGGVWVVKIEDFRVGDIKVDVNIGRAELEAGAGVEIMEP
jgi:hypothetical protein